MEELGGAQFRLHRHHHLCKSAAFTPDGESFATSNPFVTACTVGIVHTPGCGVPGAGMQEAGSACK